jgi:putative transposon-encoded protein
MNFLGKRKETRKKQIGVFYEKRINVFGSSYSTYIFSN